MKVIRLRQIKVAYYNDDLDNLKEKISKKLKVSKDKIIEVKPHKKWCKEWYFVLCLWSWCDFNFRGTYFKECKK